MAGMGGKGTPKWPIEGGCDSLTGMGELVVHLYIGLAQFFSGLLPERLRRAARTGPLWRRIVVALFVGIASVVVGLFVAALLLTAAFLVIAVVMGIARLF